VTIALIVLAVVAFIAIDAYILWRVFSGGGKAEVYGSLPVPGELRVQFPAGRVKLSYQESVYTPSGENDPIHFYPPDDFALSVTAATGGEPLPLDEGRFGGSRQSVASFMPGGPRSRTRLGFVEIPADGEYVVSASGSTQDRVEPIVLVGR
jgi:hypothetical protein